MGGSEAMAIFEDLGSFGAGEGDTLLDDLVERRTLLCRRLAGHAMDLRDLTDEAPCRAVANGVQNSHEPTRVANGLSPPNHRFTISLASVRFGLAILGHAVALVGGANGKDE